RLRDEEHPWPGKRVPQTDPDHRPNQPVHGPQNVSFNHRPATASQQATMVATGTKTSIPFENSQTVSVPGRPAETSWQSSIRHPSTLDDAFSIVHCYIDRWLNVNRDY